MFGISWNTVRYICVGIFTLIVLLAGLVGGAILLAGCGAAKPDVGNIAPTEPTNPNAAEFMREAWKGLVIVGDDPDFKKKEVALVQSFDSRVNSWGSHILRQSETKQSARGDHRSFVVPERFASFLPVRAINIWKKPLYGEYAITFEVGLKYYDLTCTVEMPGVEMVSDSGMTPCMGICGRIYALRLDGEAISVHPFSPCVHLLQRE